MLEMQAVTGQMEARFRDEGLEEWIGNEWLLQCEEDICVIAPIED